MTMETSIYSLFFMMGISCRANTNPYRVTILPLAFGFGFGAGAALGILDPLVIGCSLQKWKFGTFLAKKEPFV